MSARLARLLGADPAELAPVLAALDPAQVALREEHVADAWEARDAKLAPKLLGLLNVLPDGLVAKVAQKRMPPRFIARLASHIAPEGAGGLVGRLEPGYLAQVARWANHPRCRPVLRAIPRDALVEVAGVLERDGDWDTLAATGAELDDDALAATLTVLDPAGVRADLEHRDAAHRERIEALMPSAP